MPWSAKNDPEVCSVSEPWAVIKLDDGALVACHATQQQAEDQIAALYASEGGRPGEYNSTQDPPEEAGMSTNTNPASVTVNFNTYGTAPNWTDIRRTWAIATGTNTVIARQDDPPEAEEVEDDPEDAPEVDGGEVEGEVDPEVEAPEQEESDSEESEEDTEVVEEDTEAELKDDSEAARSRVHPVPYAFKPVTRAVVNDCRGIPPEVLERLAERHEDVGVVDRVGRGACEMRFHPEIRLNRDGTAFLHGYATVYDFPYDVAGGPPFGWSETITRDACRVSVMQGADVRLLINHEGMPLARTRSGTLRLENDDVGLYSAAPSLDPRSPTVQSLMSAMSRGDMDEMSFAFRVKEQEWNDDYTERHITEVMLFDVSVVTYPANPATVTSMRAEEPADTDSTALSEAMMVLRQLQVRGDRLRGLR